MTQIPNDTDIKYYSGHLVIDTPKPIHLSIGHISKAEVFQYSLEKADMLIELLIVLQYNIQICIYNNTNNLIFLNIYPLFKPSE